MRYELGSFPVEDVVFGPQTRWHDGILELDRDELLSLVLQDHQIEAAKLELAKPGESVRIINTDDVVDTKVKVSGGGAIYPGICGRPTDAVGHGRTHRTAGVAVRHCLDASRSQRTDVEARSLFRTRPVLGHHFLDMRGPGMETSLFNVCVVMEAPHGLAVPEQMTLTSTAVHRVADRIAETVKDLDPPELEVFDLTPGPTCRASCTYLTWPRPSLSQRSEPGRRTGRRCTGRAGSRRRGSSVRRRCWTAP